MKEPKNNYIVLKISLSYTHRGMTQWKMADEVLCSDAQNSRKYNFLVTKIVSLEAHQSMKLRIMAEYDCEI